MAVTDYIQTTEALMDFAVAQLKTYTKWSVAKHPGSSAGDILKMLPETSLPAAIVFYSSSNYANKPRRTASLSVIVAAEFQSADGRITARTLLDKAISLLDGQVSNMALFRVVSDRSLSLGANIAAYEVQFKLEDY